MKAKISVDLLSTNIPENGFVKIWWWKDTELNQELKATKPIWEIFNSYQIFRLCVIGDTIDVSEKKIRDNFALIS